MESNEREPKPISVHLPIMAESVTDGTKPKPQPVDKVPGMVTDLTFNFLSFLRAGKLSALGTDPDQLVDKLIGSQTAGAEAAAFRMLAGTTVVWNIINHIEIFSSLVPPKFPPIHHSVRGKDLLDEQSRRNRIFKEFTQAKNRIVGSNFKTKYLYQTALDVSTGLTIKVGEKLIDGKKEPVTQEIKGFDGLRTHILGHYGMLDELSPEDSLDLIAKIPV